MIDAPTDRNERMLDITAVLSVEEAVMIAESKDPKELTERMAAYSRLLFNYGYQFLEAVNPDRSWRLAYGKDKLFAFLSTELKNDPRANLVLTENPLNLELLDDTQIAKIEHIKKESHPLERMLMGGYAVDWRNTLPMHETVYLTAPRILTFKPFGIRDYKVDEEARKELEMMLHS